MVRPELAPAHLKLVPQQLRLPLRCYPQMSALWRIAAEEVEAPLPLGLEPAAAMLEVSDKAPGLHYRHSQSSKRSGIPTYEARKASTRTAPIPHRNPA